MKNLTPNPFKFGNPVEGDYYLPRPELSSAIRQFLENRIHTVLTGARRFGKTSFVLNVLKTLEKEGYTCFLVDIFNITSQKDFLQQLLRAVESKKSLLTKCKTWLQHIRSTVPKITAEFDPITGNSHFGATVSHLAEKDTQTTIQDVLEQLGGFGNKVVVAIDEFQKISEIEDKGWLEATLRTHMQTLKNVVFLFTGSRKSLISEMLNHPTRPLYRSCQMMQFPLFGAEFTDWIIDRFSSVGIRCERKAVETLRQLVQDTPNYVQMTCFHLVAQAHTNITPKDMQEALKMIAKQNAYAYQTVLNSLTLAQQRVLRLAANEKQSLFQKGLLAKYEIASAPALHASIKALKLKGILDEEGTKKGSVLFDDPLFAFWLRLQHR